jgi:hypothetical protein
VTLFREVKPNGTDAELVKAALEQRDRPREPRPVDLMRLPIAVFLGILLVIVAYWVSLADPLSWIRSASALALIAGSLLLMRAVMRADGIEWPLRRRPHRPDDRPALPGGDSTGVVDAEVVPPLAGGRDLVPLSNTAARSSVRLFGMEIPPGDSIESFARSLGFRHGRGCTNCERGGHPDFCTWERIDNRLEAGGMGRSRSGFRGDAA